MQLQWNKNGNWLLTASKDHLLKLYDLRYMKQELQVFKGHKKEATGNFKKIIKAKPIYLKIFL